MPIKSMQSEASDPSTSPARLEVLSRNKTKRIVEAVAQNPNTPPAVLLLLAETFPSQVLQNSVLPILLLERPDFLEDAYLSTLRKMLFCDAPAPSWLLTFISSRWPRMRSDVARCTDAWPELLEEFARDDYEYTRRGAASNPNTPLASLSLLAQDVATYVRCNVAMNPAALSLLPTLSEDPNPEVRCSVASNPDVPIALIERLAKDSVETVRTRVASHSNTPSALLEFLAGDEVEGVRCRVAKNKNAPPSVLEQLARDVDFRVRLDLVENPNTPESLLKLLLGDRREKVRKASRNALRRRENAER
jgi:hypothetical protein